MGALLSTEFRLVLASTSWPPSQRRVEAVQKMVLESIDWPRFGNLVKRHRVWGLVNDSLTRAGIAPPTDFARDMAAQASSVVLQSLAMAGETIRLQRAFEQAGIAACFVKGVTLAALAYGNIGIRHSKDIDLLVSVDKAVSAHALMERLGYKRVTGPSVLSADHFRLWNKFSKETAFVHPDLKIQVELHWRLADNPHLLGKVTMALATQHVPLAEGVAPRTLSQEALFAYLCVHGAKHSWFRLKWLADIAALLADKSESEITNLYRSAHELGGGRSVDQALLLCENLFGIAMPAELSTSMRRDWRARWLVSLAMTALTRGDEQTDIYDAHLGKGLAQLSLFLAGDGMHHHFGQMLYVATGVDDVAALPLPRPLWFLYPILRLPLWIWRRMHREKC